MSDYGKKTVVELQEILKSRSLPHSGKKADLITRLQDADKASEPPTAPLVNIAEDEIDWDDEGAGSVPTKASTEAGTTMIAAGGKGQVPNPQAVPNQQVDIDPSTTNDLTVLAPGEAAEAAPTTSKTTDENGPEATDTQKEETVPVKDFSQGLEATDVDTELEKRKKRAAKFGIPLNTDDKEEQQKVERAKRFGTDTNTAGAVKGLDEALPERPRKRGRGEEDGQFGGRGGKRRDFGGPGRGRRRGGGDHRENGDGGPRAVYSEKDRLAAEARKKRFATST